MEPFGTFRKKPPSPLLVVLLGLTCFGLVVYFAVFPLYKGAKDWQVRERILANLSPEERKSFDKFEHLLRFVMEPGDVLVIQSSRDGQIFTRTLQSRDENGDLTFCESSSSGDALVVHSPENTVSLLQIFGQLISIKIDRNFHAPETIIKPSPPSAGEGFFFSRY